MREYQVGGCHVVSDLQQVSGETTDSRTVVLSYLRQSITLLTTGVIENF